MTKQRTRKRNDGETVGETLDITLDGNTDMVPEQARSAATETEDAETYTLEEAAEKFTREPHDMPDEARLAVLTDFLSSVTNRAGYDTQRLNDLLEKNPEHEFILDAGVDAYLAARGERRISSDRVNDAYRELKEQLDNTNRFGRAIRALTGSDIAERTELIENMKELQGTYEHLRSKVSDAKTDLNQTKAQHEKEQAQFRSKLAAERRDHTAKLKAEAEETRQYIQDALSDLENGAERITGTLNQRTTDITDRLERRTQGIMDDLETGADTLNQRTTDITDRLERRTQGIMDDLETGADDVLSELTEAIAPTIEEEYEQVKNLRAERRELGEEVDSLDDQVRLLRSRRADIRDDIRAMQGDIPAELKQDRNLAAARAERALQTMQDQYDQLNTGTADIETMDDMGLLDWEVYQDGEAFMDDAEPYDAVKLGSDSARFYGMIMSMEEQEPDYGIETPGPIPAVNCRNNAGEAATITISDYFKGKPGSIERIPGVFQISYEGESTRLDKDRRYGPNGIHTATVPEKRSELLEPETPHQYQEAKQSLNRLYEADKTLADTVRQSGHLIHDVVGEPHVAEADRLRNLYVPQGLADKIKFDTEAVDDSSMRRVHPASYKGLQNVVEAE